MQAATQDLLSQEMLATAESIRDIRRRLYNMTAEVGMPPTFDVNDVFTVLVEGLAVAAALDRLAHD